MTDAPPPPAVPTAPVLDYGRPRPGWVRPSWAFVVLALLISLGGGLLAVGLKLDGPRTEDAAAFAGVGTFLVLAGGFGLLAVLRPGLGRSRP